MECRLYSFIVPQKWHESISLQWGELRGKDTFRVCGASSPRCFRRTMCRTRAVWKDVRWQAFLVIHFFKKVHRCHCQFKNAPWWAFISVRFFFGKHGPQRRKHPYNLTEWLTTIERRKTAKQGQSRWRGKSSQRLFCVLFQLLKPTFFGVG